MPNNMTFEQAATLLTAAVKQATGQTTIAAITTPEQLVSTAQTALKTGYDPIIYAIGQVWSKTIFRARNYTAPLSSLEMTLERYGNATRKISPVAMDMGDDERYKYPVAYSASETSNPYGDGLSVDHYKINKQKNIQTNFYGTSVYRQRFTIFKDQFDSAMSSADEFARFNAMNMTERANDRESYREGVARTLQANFVGALLDEGNADRVIHLLTEYNAETGLTLTAQTVYQPDNFAPFMRWVYARVKTLSRMMAERSEMYQTVINGAPVLRHTPAENLRIAIYSKALDQMEAMVMSDTYHDNYLKYATIEGVSFWQSIETPDSIAIQPTYTHTDGSVKKATAPVEQAGIFALIHDKEAIGYCATNNWSATTPLNIDGGYWNESYHSTFKTVSDNTEKAVVLLLD